MSEFRLTNPELDLRGKKRANIHHETKNRHMKLAMAQIAMMLNEIKDIEERDVRRLEGSDKILALHNMAFIETLEERLAYKFSKYFKIVTPRTKKEVQLTIDTKGKK